MKHKFSTEYDGSLVCDNVVIISPSSEFPKAAIAELVQAHNEHAALCTVAEAAEQLLKDHALCALNDRALTDAIAALAAARKSEVAK